MANFDRRGVTQAGINLMGKAIGGATIQFTKLVLGDGEMTGEILDLQGVVSPKQNVDVTRIERNDNQCTVGGELLTKSVKQGFFWRECGLYAMDPDVGEILYNYAYSTKPDYIAASDSGMMEEILVSMVALVGANANVDISIDTSMVLTTKREFDPIKYKVDRGYVDVKDFGAKGDNATDDTIAIQSAINYASSTGISNVVIPSGTYLINTDAINLKSNMSLSMSKNTILKMIPTELGLYKLLNIDTVENVIIDGGKLVGDRNEHLSSEDERGIGIRVKDGKNITIKNITTCDFWGDGIMVWGTETDKVLIDNVISDNNRRQGASLCGGKNITVSNSIFKNTNGTAPQAGIDIEPSHDGEGFIKEINILNCVFENNAGYGVQVCYNTKNCLINGCKSLNNNGGFGIIGSYHGGTLSPKHISVVDCSCEGNTERGIMIDNAEIVIIRGNIIDGSKTSIYIFKSINIDVCDNKINNPSFKYVEILTNSEFCKVYNNTMRGCTNIYFAIGVTDSNYCDIINNTIHGDFNDGVIYIKGTSIYINCIDNIYKTTKSTYVRKDDSVSEVSVVGITATAKPSTGHWILGTIVGNKSIAIGSDIGWICITSGYPGVWKSIGIIQ